MESRFATPLGRDLSIVLETELPSPLPRRGNGLTVDCCRWSPSTIGYFKFSSGQDDGLPLTHSPKQC